MAKTTKFAHIQTGMGVTGMELKLNLQQCQVLNMSRESLEKANTLLDSNSVEEIANGREMLKQTVQSLMPFLNLFNEFQHLNDPNMWVNEYRYE